jgi:hypothetical protein
LGDVSENTPQTASTIDSILVMENCPFMAVIVNEVSSVLV